MSHFIPLRNDNSLSRQLLGNEYYYEFKVFLNCQSFQLNADRSVVTNMDSDEVTWIWQDFVTNVWPSIEQKARPYRSMSKNEEAAIESVKKTKASAALKASYATAPNVSTTKEGVELRFVKSPKKEADVSHLLAMMVQSGSWAKDLDPIVRFGQYIDDSTDILVEDAEQNALLVEVETGLPNLFRHKHPMNSYDPVVVWDLGGMSNGTVKTAPWGSHGANVAVTLLSTADGGWQLKWGVHQKRVVVLSEVV